MIFLVRLIFTDYDLNEFDLVKFKDQMEKDLKVNILQDGKWGTCLALELDVEPNLSKSVFKFSDIR